MDSFRRWAVRAGVGTMLAAAVAAGGYGIAEAASGSSRAADQPAVTLVNAPTKAGRGHDAIRRHLKRALRSHGYVIGSGTLESFTGDSVTVVTKRLGTRTVHTTSRTVYVAAMTPVPRSDLRVGEQVSLLVKLGSAGATAGRGATVT
ncbi:MAG TPA: hypothetical protein VGP46_07200, partial [Acidimicrobiales bacterium]|nr:hypothetical protein [Acidimicrobiales bacterium]